MSHPSPASEIERAASWLRDGLESIASAIRTLATTNDALACAIANQLSNAVDRLGDQMSLHGDEVASALESVAASVDARSPTPTDASAPGASKEA